MLLFEGFEVEEEKKNSEAKRKNQDIVYLWEWTVISYSFYFQGATMFRIFSVDKNPN